MMALNAAEPRMRPGCPSRCKTLSRQEVLRMSTPTSAPGITFAVQQVERATRPLPTCQTHEAINRLLDRQIEACCDYTSNCIQKVTSHPLVAAHFSFSQHR